MKSLKRLFIITAIFLSAACFAQELELPPAAHSFLNCKYTMDEGFSYAQITRIEVMQDRSNFVRENMLLGAYYTIQTEDLSFFDLITSVSVYYPFYQAFNGMKQKQANMFNFALDGFFGAKLTYNRLKYIILDFSLGMHYMYQLTDEYYMHYLGIGLLAQMEFPISKNWTLIESNFIAYDNPNLGSNKNIQPFDSAYQYHINLGVRYSKKVQNQYHYVK